MKTLNFNKLAWEAPVRNGQAGYLPTDEYYKEIIEWLRTGNTVWKVKMTNDVIQVRKEFKGLEYDVIVKYTKSTGSVIWWFRRHNEFRV
jgi:hypothetical protein